MKRYKFSVSDGTISEAGISEFLDLNVGTHDKPPVITSTSTGESSLRDFNWVLKNDGEESTYVDMIIEDRKKLLKLRHFYNQLLKKTQLLKNLR